MGRLYDLEDKVKIIQDELRAKKQADYAQMFQVPQQQQPSGIAFYLQLTKERNYLRDQCSMLESKLKTAEEKILIQPSGIPAECVQVFAALKNLSVGTRLVRIGKGWLLDVVANDDEIICYRTETLYAAFKLAGLI